MDDQGTTGDNHEDPRLDAVVDSFGRILGDEWVAVEPGIYRLASDLRAEAERERRLREAEAEPLDESLLGAIPSREEQPTRPQSPPVQQPGRGWFRRR